MNRRVAVAGAGLALGAAVLFAACGDDGGSSYVEPSGAAQETVAVEGGNFFFDPEELTLPAGVNEIELVGAGGIHTLVVEGVDGYKLRVEGGGETDAEKLELTPGEYEFWCDITGHREAGMEGTLVVE